jgi:hypothetical protein
MKFSLWSKLSLLSLLLFPFLGALLGAPFVASLGAASELFSSSPSHLQSFELQVNHWVLAKPGGKPITVLDLAKRLEMVFYREFPQYANSPQFKYQFFRVNWRPVLDDMVNYQLILADAKEKNVEVNDGEVTKEMEESFGPNVVQTIDQLHLSYDEAWEMIKIDLIVRRMKGFMVHSRALTRVSPALVREVYEKTHTEKNLENEWEFQVLSIRNNNSELAAKAAEAAAKLMEEQPGITLELLKERLTAYLQPAAIALTSEAVDEETTLSLSQRESRAPKDLSPPYRKALESLQPGDVSKPVSQPSRDGSIVYRIFHFIALNVKLPPPFAEVFPKLHEELTQVAMEEEYDKYVSKLRQHYNITPEYFKEMIPEKFQPFSLK